MELACMAHKDQAMRRDYKKTGTWNKRLDRQNSKRMKQIIAKYGWPTITMVGKTGSRNAWLLVQHADHDLKLQTGALAQMQSAFGKSNKEINPMHIAYLTDRILVNRGEKQIFGTQFYFTKKRLLDLRATRDLKNVDIRRKLYGLGPIKNDIKTAKIYGKSETRHSFVRRKPLRSLYNIKRLP